MGALISQAVSDQLSQYPPARPQPTPFVGPPNPNAGLQGIPTAAQETLQPSNLLGDFIDRIYAPGFQRQFGPTYGPMITNVMKQVAPLMLGGIGGAGAAEEGSEAGSLLAGTERLPARATTSLPEAAAPTARLTAPPSTEMLHYATTPLGELAAQPERFHGTPVPIRQLGTAEQSEEGNLYYKGLYTTNKYTVAGGYSGTYGEFGTSPAGPIYRVYENTPVKFIDAEDKIPDEVFARLKNGPQGTEWMRLKRDSERAPGAAFQPRRVTVGDFLHMHSDLPGKYFGAYGKDIDARDQLVEQLYAEGYGGLEHEGGIRTGGTHHRVKIYWHPERDVTLRLHGEVHPKLRIPSHTPPVPSTITPEAQGELFRRSLPQVKVPLIDPWR